MTSNQQRLDNFHEILFHPRKTTRLSTVPSSLPTKTIPHHQSFQLLERLGRHAVIHAVEEVEVPRLAVAVSQFGDSAHAGVVLLLLRGAVLRARRLDGGEVVDDFFFRLRCLLHLSSVEFVPRSGFCCKGIPPLFPHPGMPIVCRK